MALTDRTIIYYSANTEEEGFAQRIREDLLKKANGIPIISVTRKPIDFGTNICVGEQPVSYTNEWRQLLIGLKAASTRFCITAESDCLYPEEYFTFTPDRDDLIHYYDNIYLVWRRHNGFWKKTGHCEGAEMCGREFWISRLEPLLGHGWEPFTRDYENYLVKQFFPEEALFSGNAVVTFKTGNGVSCRSTYVNKKIYDIPYWGNVGELKKKYI
jgi:hypothetical protein